MPAFFLLLFFFVPSSLWADSYGAGGVTRSFSYELIFPQDVTRLDLSPKQELSLGKHPKDTIRKFDSKDYSQFVSLYSLGNLFDKNSKTAWCEPDEGSGQGYAIKIVPNENLKIKGVRIIDGYAKSEDTFRDNNRLRSFTLKQGETVTSELLKDLAKPQSIPSDSTVVVEKGSSILLELGSFYYGRRFNDTCLSEVEFILEDNTIWPQKPNYYFGQLGGCCAGPAYTLFDSSGKQVFDQKRFYGTANFSPTGKYVVFDSDSTNVEGAVLIDLVQRKYEQLIPESEGIINVHGWSNDEKVVFGDRCIFATERLESHGASWEENVQYREKFEFDVQKRKFIKLWDRQKDPKCS